MNKSSNNVTLSSPMTYTDVLTLTSGNIITTSTNLLNVPATATIRRGSSSSYVSGPMTKVINAGGSFTAPVGKITPGRYRPVTVAATSGADTWNIEYFGVNATSAGYNNAIMNTANILTVSMYEYWMVNPGTTTSAGLTLTYDVGSYSPPIVGVLTDLRVARWESSVP